MYRCYECDALFEPEEARTVTESRGEFWGTPCSESFSVCPHCGSENFTDVEDIETSILWQELVDNGTATEEELRLVTQINGLNNGTLLDVLYAREGLRSVEQFYKEVYR